MLARLAACCFIVLAALPGCATTHPYTTLKDAYAGRFLIGTACDPGNYSDAEQANIQANYNVITPENCMKPGPIHPSEDTYNFGPPDTHPNYRAIEKAIDDYHSLGLKVMITEMDIAVSGANSGAWAPGGFGRPLGPASAASQGAATQNAPATRPALHPDPGAQAAALQRQANAYRRLFQLFDRHALTITRVTFCGINDRRSWRAWQQPLLFDAQMQPKPAYQAILDVANQRNRWFF